MTDDSSAAERARAREEEVREAEGRVRALRDEMVLTADWLAGAELVRVAEIVGRLAPRAAVLAGREMPQEIEMIRDQLQAMFQRLRTVAAAHPEPVPATDHGLPGDARFLRDMAGYLSHMLGQEE